MKVSLPSCINWQSPAAKLPSNNFLLSAILMLSLNVDTPAILTLSKFVWPSTSISPEISNPPATAVPSIVTPVAVVASLAVEWLLLS